MGGPARTGGPALIGATLAALGRLLLGGAPAAAQDAESPFRYLRPSVADDPATAAPPLLDMQAAAPAPITDPPPLEQGEGAPHGPVATPSPAPGPQPLRLGVLAGRDVRARMAVLEPMVLQLGQALGRRVELLPMASYGTMVEAQATWRVDGGFYSAAAYADAQHRCGCLEPIAAPTAADGAVAYHAIVVARRNSGISNATELGGKTVAVGAADSVAARLMQLAGLAEEGIDPSRFAAVRETGSAEEAVRLVAAGEVDAAFAWSSLTGDVATGYSRGTLADLVAGGEIAMDRLVIVWRSPAITHGPFAVSKSLPVDEKERIEEVLLALERSLPDAYDALNPFYAGGYVAVEPAAYDGLELLVTGKATSAEDRAEPAKDEAGSSDR